MKRTIEEMISHIKEHHLEAAMINIAMNNDKGFAFVPVEIEDVYKRNDKYYIYINGYGEEEIEPIENVNMDRLSHHLNRLSGVVVIHDIDTENEKYTLILAHGENQDDANEKMQYMLFQDMLVYFKLNTFGKLNVLIGRSEEIQGKYIEGMRKKRELCKTGYIGKG